MKKAKIYIVKHESQAKYNVCFVDYSSQEKNIQLVCPGELVKHENQAEIKVFIVNHTSQADILIMRKNFPV